MGSVTSLNATHLALNGSREMHFSEIREHNNNMHNHIGNVVHMLCYDSFISAACNEGQGLTACSSV